MSLVINGHFLAQKITGVQRYAIEIVKQFERQGIPFGIKEIDGFSSKNKIGHHLWEQGILPSQLTKDDLLWSPTNTGPVLAKRQIITLHDLAVFAHPEWFSPKYRLWRTRLIPLLAQNSLGIVTVSDFSKGIILEHLNINPDKVRVVYNGINTSKFFTSDESSIREMKAELNLTGNYILTLGSLDPRKNLKGILNAWSLIKRQQPDLDYQLVVAGGKGRNFNQTFSTQEVDNQDVTYLGYVDDELLAPLYSGASLFVYPSFFEGFGLPVLEAMSCGVPVVTSDTGALKEVSGNAAELVDPANPEDIAQGILNVLSSTKRSEELIEQGLKRVEKFSWDKCAKETYDYIKQFS